MLSHIVERVKTSTTIQAVYQCWNLKTNSSAGTKVYKANFESDSQNIEVIPIADESGDCLLWRWNKFEKVRLSRHTESKRLWIREIVTSKYIRFLEMSHQFLFLQVADERFSQLLIINLANGKVYEYSRLYREFNEILSAKIESGRLAVQGIKGNLYEVIVFDLKSKKIIVRCHKLFNYELDEVFYFEKNKINIFSEGHVYSIRYWI